MDEPKERLVIENFAGIRFLEMEISPFTVIIGPQSVGKSVTAKLLYFFQNITMFLRFAALDENSAHPKDVLSNQFEQFFPSSIHGGQKCVISYRQGDSLVTIKSGGKLGGWKISVPAALGKAFSLFTEQPSPSSQNDPQKTRLARYDHEREIEYYLALNSIFPNCLFSSQFIPAGRSFYAQIRDNMASFLTRASLDIFVTQFGIFFDQIKRRVPKARMPKSPLAPAARQLCEQLLSGRYVRLAGEDFIDAVDGRRLPAAFWSSGQQEAQPLTAILLHFCEYRERAVPLFIEEPEAHLFPSAQRVVTELIALAFHSNLPHSRMFITTHSPYILTTINNLLMAGQVYEGASPKIKRALGNTVPADRALSPGSMGAFFMDQDGCRSIMESDTGLIGASAIDEVSGVINETFERLLDLQYRE